MMAPELVANLRAQDSESHSTKKGSKADFGDFGDDQNALLALKVRQSIVDVTSQKSQGSKEEAPMGHTVVISGSPRSQSLPKDLPQEESDLVAVKRSQKQSKKLGSKKKFNEDMDKISSGI